MDQELATGDLPATTSGAKSNLDGLASLVDKSLVRRVGPALDAIDRAAADETRYDPLETVREFGLEQLERSGEAQKVRAAHAAYVAETVSATTEETSRLDLLEAEHPNLRAALAWTCADGSAAIALRLAKRLAPFWLRRSYQREGQDRLTRALAASPNEDPTLRAAALNALGDLLRDLGEHAEAERAFARARDLTRAVGNRREEATALRGLSALSDNVRDDAATKAHSEASVTLWRQLGDRSGLSHALHNLGWAEAGLGKVVAALALLREALGHARAVGDTRAVAHFLGSLGGLLAEQGDYAAARPLVEEALAVARTIGDESEIAEISADLGWLTARRRDHLRRRIRAWAWSGSRPGCDAGRGRRRSAARR